MTTTLAPPDAVPGPLPDRTPAGGQRAGLPARLPRVTAILLVRPEGLEPTSGLAAGRLPDVLDALARQARPPERLVVVAAQASAQASAQAGVVDPSGSMRVAGTEDASSARRAGANESNATAEGAATGEAPGGAEDAGADRDSGGAEDAEGSGASWAGDEAAAVGSAQNADNFENRENGQGPTAADLSFSDRVRALLDGHDALRRAVPDQVVVELTGRPHPRAVVDAALTEADPAGLPGVPDVPGGGADRPTGTTHTESSSGPSTRPEWLWLLDDTTAPTAGALLRLVEAVRRSRSVGIVGPKVVRWDNARILVEMGHQVTRTGRRVDAPAAGEADQGQYDTRTDVLAVGTHGLLVDREVLDQVGGFDPTLPDEGAGLDLGWRAQLAGRRVVVVPGAVLRRSRSMADVQHGPLRVRRAQRRAAREVALTRCALPAAPFVALWILLTSLVSAAALVVLKRPQHAWAELGDLGGLVHPVATTGARWRFRGRRTVGRRHLASLFVTGGAAVGHTWDRVQEALTPDRRTEPVAAPSTADVAEPGPVSEEAEALTGLPPSLPQRIVTNPGFLAVVVCAALSALTFRGALTGGLLDAQGTGLAGGELYPVVTDAGGLWHQFRDAWHGAGFGNALEVSSATGVLAALTWLVQLVPYVDDGRSPAAVTLAWLTLAAMPLAAGSAYLAARFVTHARWGRGLVALAWGSSAVLVAAATHGRISVVVAHILLPAVVAGFGFAMTRQGTWTATFGTALAAAVIGSFVPVLLALVVAVALVCVAAAPGFGRRLRALVLAVVPVGLLGPWALRFVDDPRLLLTGPGLLDVSAAGTSPWRILLAQPDSGGPAAGDRPGWVGLLVVPVLVLAVLALARRSGGPGRSAALNALAVVAVLGLAGAFLSDRVGVGTAVGADGAPTLATLWAGVALEVYLVAALGILLVGWHGLGAVLGARESRLGWRRLVAAGVAGVVALGVLGGGALSAWSSDPSAGNGGGDGADGATSAGAGVRLATGALPAVAVDQANGPDGNRLVVLTPSADRLDFSLVGNEPGELMRDVTRPTDVTDPGLAAVLGTIESGGSLPGGAGDALADLGVGFVSLRAAPDSPLGRTLDASSGLTRLGSDDSQTLWRVVGRPSATAADVTVPPSRVRLDTADGTVTEALPVDGPHGAVAQDLSVGAAGRSLVVAEAPQWAGHAVVTYDGQVLRPAASAGTPTYALPSSAGHLDVDLPPSHPRWFLVQLALLAVVVFLAVPFGTRRSRRVR